MRLPDDRHLRDLTDEQRSAVLHEEGPLLVVAGPGSGKTRVITSRVAHLVARGINPASILAITFTNKAAGEMQRRVLDLCPAHDAWIRTFHSACAAILRRWPRSAGLESGFSIFDTADQLRVVKSSLKALDIPTGFVRPRQALTSISNWKMAGIRPEEARTTSEGHLQDEQARIYARYAQTLDEFNAVDFDDLLVRTLAALQDDDELRRRLQYRFEYVLIDEYQDTSPVQFQLAHILAERTGNICATGDPDQAIYAFRKADVRNILDFERTYPDATVVRLQWNFRSVGNVLAAADSLIGHNRNRHEKRLLTNAEDGPKLRVIATTSETEEGKVVAREILDAYARGVPYRDIAVFYRVNAQSRAIEMGLRSAGIPYVIVRGVEFYQRAEVKDLLAYLRLLANPRDRESMIRVLSTPPKGIGAKSLAKIEALARGRGLNAREVLLAAAEHAGLSKRACLGLRATEDLLASHDPQETALIAALLRRLITFLDYEEFLRRKYPGDHEDRRDNVRELVAAAEEYDTREAGGGNLVDFLTEVGLVTDVDSYDPESPHVPLMTLHSAKGLEFREVIIAGLEEGLLPHARSLLAGDTAVEEERRLLFVGITRAKVRLTMTYSLTRRAGIGSEERESTFIEELPPDLLERSGTTFRRPPPRDPYRRRQPRGTGWGDQRADHGADPVDASVHADHGSGFHADAEVDYGLDADPFEDLRPGTRVMHEHFGEGHIRRLMGRGIAARAVVRFPIVGDKTLSLEHARLTVLE